MRRVSVDMFEWNVGEWASLPRIWNRYPRAYMQAVRVRDAKPSPVGEDICKQIDALVVDEVKTF